MLAAAVASYVLLVFWAASWFSAVPLIVMLALGVAGIGFDIQHDGGHGSYSRSSAVNHLAARCLDLVGASSYVWRWKHNRFHHQYTNVDGVDSDIDVAPFLRLAPTQRLRAAHRFQHWYAWFLYCLLLVKWHLYDDFRDLVLGRIGSQVMPRPRGRDAWMFWGGKALFFGWAFGLPLLRHSLVGVLASYLLCAAIVGLLLSTVFQLAHCVESSSFTGAPAPGDSLPETWAEHQLASSVDFAQENRWVTWALGGLNYQKEHHLFTYVSHVHYPALAPIVRELCRERRITYLAHPTVWQALVSHARWLRRMGRPAGVECTG